MPKLFEFFSGTAILSKVFQENGWRAQTLDKKKYRFFNSPGYTVDFLKFDYKSEVPGSYEVLWFGLPCTAWSKASGGYHFDKNFIPKTQVAWQSIAQLKRCFEIIDFLKPKYYFVENPTSGLFKYLDQTGIFKARSQTLIRFDMASFGGKTQKKTDLITNCTNLFLANPTYRINGINQDTKFHNLTYLQRIAYPRQFCQAIFNLVNDD